LGKNGEKILEEVFREKIEQPPLRDNEGVFSLILQIIRSKTTKEKKKI